MTSTDAAHCSLSWSRLATMALGALGLSLMGFWTNDLGYGSSILPNEIPLTDHSIARIGYLLGSVICGVLLLVGPSKLTIGRPSDMLIATLSASSGALLYSLAWRQNLLNPQTLACTGALVAGLAYPWLVLAFYLLLAKHLSFRACVVAIAASLMAETLVSPLVDAVAGAQAQVYLAALLPLTVLAVYGIAARFAMDPRPSKPQPFANGTFYAQIAIASLSIIVLRALTDLGVWGGTPLSHSTAELGPFWLAISCAILALVAFAAFVAPKLNPRAQFVPAFGVLSLGFLAVALEPVFGIEGGPLVTALTMAIESFAHLTFWLAIILGLQTATRPLRVAGTGPVFYGLFGIAWIAIFEPLDNLSTAVLFTSVYAVSLVALVIAFGSSSRTTAPRSATQPASQDNSTTAPQLPSNPPAANSVRYNLSPREAEVFSLLIEGLSAPQIAERLCIAESTVKTHVLHIYEKLGVRSKAALFALVATNSQPPQS